MDWYVRKYFLEKRDVSYDLKLICQVNVNVALSYRCWLTYENFPKRSITAGLPLALQLERRMD